MKQDVVPASQWLWKRSNGGKHMPSVLPLVSGPTDGSVEMKSEWDVKRSFEIDVYDLVHEALNCYSSLNQPFHLKFQQLRSFHKAFPPSPWALQCGLLNNRRDPHRPVQYPGQSLKDKRSAVQAFLFPHLPFFIFILPKVGQNGHLQLRRVEGTTNKPKSNR